MRVVLDSNVIVSGIFFKGSIPHKILEAWLEGQFSIYATRNILDEYLRSISKVGAYMKLSPPLLDWGKVISNACHIISDLKAPAPISRDPDDDKFILCAVHAGASYLVTGDKDLLSLKQDFGFQILPPRPFLKLLGA